MKKQKNKTGKSKNEISKKMTFAEIMEKNPEAVGILMEKGMHCVGCHMAMYETLEQGCIAHGIDTDEIVKEINEKLNKNKKKKWE